MAAPNYQFEKRKRELAKKAAKQEKKLRKAEKSTTSDDAETPAATEGEAVTEAAPPAEG